MVDHPRLSFRPRRLAVHAGTSGTIGSEAGSELSAAAPSALCPGLRARHSPRKRGVWYAAASRSGLCRLWNTGSSGPVYAKVSPGFPVLARRSFSEGGKPDDDKMIGLEQTPFSTAFARTVGCPPSRYAASRAVEELQRVNR